MSLLFFARPAEAGIPRGKQYFLHFPDLASFCSFVAFRFPFPCLLRRVEVRDTTICQSVITHHHRYSLDPPSYLLSP